MQTVDPLGRIAQYGYDNDYREVTEKWLLPGGGSATYTMTVAYDAAVASTTSGTPTQRWTVYDGQTPLLDFKGSGLVTARYLSVPGAIYELLARQTASGVAWYFVRVYRDIFTTELGVILR